MAAVRAVLDADPAAVHVTGPHPFWGGRPQPLVAIESNRDETFDLILARGADPNGRNDAYDGCSPLMLTAHRGRSRMREALIAAGARVGVVEALMVRRRSDARRPARRRRRRRRCRLGSRTTRRCCCSRARRTPSIG